MPIYISDSEVSSLISPAQAIQVIDELFLDESRGLAEQTPMVELPLPRGVFKMKVGGAYGAANSFGFKAYLGSAGFRVFVYDVQTGWDGLVEAFELTEIRTGGVSAVGVKYLAREDASVLGMIGTGREARAQLRAIAGVRKLKTVRAYSRDVERRRGFASEMSEQLGLDVVAADSAEDCVRGADIIVTITNANEPVLEGSWIAEGAFICGVGATGPYRRELDELTVKRASTIVVESMSGGMAECGDLIYAVNKGSLRWNRVREFKDIVSGLIPARRNSEDITLFDTVGTGAEDVAVAAFVVKEARKQGIGMELAIPAPRMPGQRTNASSRA